MHAFQDQIIFAIPSYFLLGSVELSRNYLICKLQSILLYNNFRSPAFHP